MNEFSMEMVNVGPTMTAENLDDLKRKTALRIVRNWILIIGTVATSLWAVAFAFDMIEVSATSYKVIVLVLIAHVVLREGPAAVTNLRIWHKLHRGIRLSQSGDDHSS